MKFHIRGKEIEEDVTSVVLQFKAEDSLESLLLWHCPICTEPLFQFSGKMISIIPGSTPTKIPVIVDCRKCKNKYLINSIV
jgi:uncharacterized protein with PIN domain